MTILGFHLRAIIYDNESRTSCGIIGSSELGSLFVCENDTRDYKVWAGSIDVWDRNEQISYYAPIDPSAMEEKRK